jgi:hypothetical protein
MDDDDRLPKKYTLVRDPAGNLYAVAKNEAVDLQATIPAADLQVVKNKLNTVENEVEATLVQYLAAPSGVRVRVPKILD